jgi:diaminohydroxyphosphoribosylaminopyrimidine deaminase/5-amino-6-(5-phosphoribosylamino)uracil reductase
VPWKHWLKSCNRVDGKVMVICALPDDFLAHAMQHACREARCWLGATAPNPPVGAVALDVEGRVLAVAAHQRAGQGHAEALLLERLRAHGLLEKTHTLCVTLEPCNHHGRTPPCAEAIIAAGIRHVAVGVRDPNPQVSGGGIEHLRAAGVVVTLGIEELVCQQLLYAFAHRVTQGRPWLTVKRALDGRGSMIPPVGQKTFTSPSALRLAHQLRKRADAILTGSGTILADHPCFTVRHVPDYAGKQRVLAILDRRHRVPAAYLAAAAARGFIPVIYDDLIVALDDLARRGVLDVLVEAGPELSCSILATDLWTQNITIEQLPMIQSEVKERISVNYKPERIGWLLTHMIPEETGAMR